MSGRWTATLFALLLAPASAGPPSAQLLRSDAVILYITGDGPSDTQYVQEHSAGP